MNTDSNNFSWKALIVCFLIGAIIGLAIHFAYDTKTITSPIEVIEIDSISKENTKLIIEVEHLDSVKDAKVIEVKSLDNDSTLRLFYQLIGK